MKIKATTSKLALQGGEPIRLIPWPTYDKGDVCIDHAECYAAWKVIKSKLPYRYDFRDIGDTETGRLEKELTEFFGVKYALALSSGTTALSVSMMACDIGAGDEVLCSSFGFPASPSSILLTGASPVLVEVNENLHIDIHDLKKKINSATKAILMVHMRAQIGNIEAVLKIAGEYGILLIEDAVPVLGVKVNGRYAGTFGIAGAFSTQSDKSMNTGEGGFMLTNDRELFEKAVLLSGAYEGRHKRHCNESDGSINPYLFPLYNFRMDEIRASVARVQLRKVPSRIKVMNKHYARAYSIISKYSEFRIREPHYPGANLGDSILFSIRDNDVNKAYWLSNALNAEGIECRSFSNLDRPNVRAFWTWEFLYKDYSQNDIKKMLPNSAKYIESTLDIPYARYPNRW